MAQWKISGRQMACSICSHQFEDGERHHSMVSFTEDQVHRGDFCQSCWEQNGSPEQVAQAHAKLEAERAAGEESAEPESSDPVAAAGEAGEERIVEPHRFWWTTHHQAKPQKTLQMDMDALQRLFLELEGREETKLRELRYVLCLLLMRKKRVKLERILRDDEGESFIVRRPKLDARYTVEVFDFTPERMAEVREHLQAIFDGVDDDEALAQAARGEEEEDASEDMAEQSAE